MPGGWAIVGTGVFAERRMAPALNRAVGSRFVAVVSRDQARADEFAAEHGAKHGYGDLATALRDPEVRYVWVATPHSLHLEPVLAAARAGKHVLCEKPLATSAADAREMLRACRRAGVALGTGFHLRYHPLLREARRLANSGALGNVVAAEAEWSVPVPRGNGGYNSAWRSQPALAYAGITTGTGIHALDLLRFVLDDEVMEVSAFTDALTSPLAPLETRAAIMLRFGKGTLATVRCLRGVARPQNDLLLIGTEERLAVRHALDETTHGLIEAGGLEPEIIGYPAGVDMYTLEVEAFMQAADAGDEPGASGEDGLRMVEILAAVLESARSGRAISLA